MADVRLATPRGELPGHLATPSSGAGPWPGVVVIHEAFGLTDDVRGIADRFAERGYLALAPDFFAWDRRMACVRAALRELGAREGRMFDDLDAARVWLRDRPECSGLVGVIGFCMGAGFALLAAPRSGYGVASVNYGQVPGDAESVLAGSCPIVASYGRRDRGLRGHAERLEQALTVLGVERDVKVYPDAGHSFLNRNSGTMALVFGKVFGAGYHGPSAEDAWQRILAFFDAHLHTGPAAEADARKQA
jgi:carboxymethylenebutenolidase